MRNKIMAVVAALLFTAGLGLAATPAQAASQGPAGYITFWDGCSVGYCGAAWPIPQSVTLNACYPMPTGANDKWTAFSNNTSHNFKVWTAGGCTGSVATLYAGTETGQMGSPFNNSISSYKRIS